MPGFGMGAGRQGQRAPTDKPRGGGQFTCPGCGHTYSMVPANDEAEQAEDHAAARQNAQQAVLAQAAKYGEQE